MASGRKKLPPKSVMMPFIVDHASQYGLLRVDTTCQEVQQKYCIAGYDLASGDLQTRTGLVWLTILSVRTGRAAYLVHALGGDWEGLVTEPVRNCIEGLVSGGGMAQRSAASRDSFYEVLSGESWEPFHVCMVCREQKSRQPADTEHRVKSDLSGKSHDINKKDLVSSILKGLSQTIKSKE